MSIDLNKKVLLFLVWVRSIYLDNFCEFTYTFCMSNLYSEIFKLKQELRKGWIERNVCCNNRVESDAEHIFSCSILALEIMEKERLNLDKLKVLKMLLYHELGEIDYGDHTPQEHISKEEKHQKEKVCLERISKECKNPEILKLWLEFEERKTPESIFVYEMDKLDAIVQSKIYAQKCNKPQVFEEFYNNNKLIAKKYKKYI